MNSTVRYSELPDGGMRTIVVVHPANANAQTARFSVLSPVGRALLGRKTGSVVQVQLPSGNAMRVKILADIPVLRLRADFHGNGDRWHARGATEIAGKSHGCGLNFMERPPWILAIFINYDWWLLCTVAERCIKWADPVATGPGSIRLPINADRGLESSPRSRPKTYPARA